MGVDLSFSVEVGFVIEAKYWDAFLAKEPDGFEDGTAEVLWCLVRSEPLLTYGVAGSYYERDNEIPYVSVKRLSAGGDSRSIQGGVYGVHTPVVTLAEREALQRVAYLIGVPFSDPYQFAAVLWH